MKEAPKPPVIVCVTLLSSTSTLTVPRAGLPSVTFGCAVSPLLPLPGVCHTFSVSPTASADDGTAPSATVAPTASRVARQALLSLFRSISPPTSDDQPFRRDLT